MYFGKYWDEVFPAEFCFVDKGMKLVDDAIRHFVVFRSFHDEVIGLKSQPIVDVVTEFLIVLGGQTGDQGAREREFCDPRGDEGLC